MSDNKNSRRGMFGKGYYIALILCAAAIGITGYLYYRSSQNTGDTQVLATEPDTPVIATQGQEDIAVIATHPQSDPSQQAIQATEPTVKRALKTVSPVSGQQVYSYSVEALSYNETTRDWRVHDGLDIAADAGTDVTAAADGQVYTIYTDEVMGTTVVIRHEGGYTTKYASLSEDLSVKVGDSVTVGQKIGTVDTTALTETVLGPHVHFSVTYQDLPMDPVEFLSMG